MVSATEIHGFAREKAMILCFTVDGFYDGMSSWGGCRYDKKDCQLKDW